jgi:UDP-GlcNAc:undecaprenyl-phosphate/decaprenyl-phosphate GlcNAc-1-phosphate transferase
MIYFVLFFLNFLFIFFFDKLKKKINIYDIPDEQKKIHSEKVPLLGGIIFIFNLGIFVLYSLLFEPSSILSLFGFSSFFAVVVFLLSTLLVFCVGILDDKINLSAKLRILFLILIVILNLSINQTINISSVKLSFADTFSIGIYSYLWTLICFLLFINAFNFFDGINLQSSGLIFAICAFFLHKNIFPEIFLVILLANLFFSYLNYNSKIFLGNGGSFFLPFFIGCLFISAYNNNPDIVSDEIVILILVPGLDLLRLFFFRVLNKKNPFKGDKEHIHHYLIKSFSRLSSALIIQTLIWIPFLISQIFDYFLIALFMQLFFYSLIVIKYRN